MYTRARLRPDVESQSIKSPIVYKSVRVIKDVNYQARMVIKDQTRGEIRIAQCYRLVNEFLPLLALCLKDVFSNERFPIDIPPHYCRLELAFHRICLTLSMAICISGRIWCTVDKEQQIIIIGKLVLFIA
jgi:hypothetical protein